MRKPSGNYKFADRFRYRNNGIYNNDIMKKWLSLIILLAVNVISINAQQKNSINNQSMEKKTKTIRLIYPQWQGGDIARWITEIKDPEAASKGYFLGAELLNFLAPDSSQETLTVPISTEITERRKKDGVLDRDIIVKQTKAALDLLRISDPDKIVTLGGECSTARGNKERHSTPRQSGRFNGQRHFTQYLRLCGKPTDTIVCGRKR